MAFGIQQENPMNRNQKAIKAAAWLPAFFILAALTFSHSPVRAESRQYDDSLAPGVYKGTFIFTIEHTYNRPAEGVPVNYFSLRAEEVMGTIRFSVDGAGVITGNSIRIPSFNYNAVNSQTITVPEGSQGEYNCTGNSSYAAGMGTASVGSGSSGAPPLIPGNFSFYTKPIKIKPGDPWGRVSLIGKCPGKGDSKGFTEAVKGDINALPASPWVFTVNWQSLQSAGGSCSTASWQVVDHSITCSWAAYSGGYTRKTAPG
jgi:hypothetical protein